MKCNNNTLFILSILTLISGLTVHADVLWNIHRMLNNQLLIYQERDNFLHHAYMP